ncbi:GTPase IMAP family member 6 [Etheostoma spectabile]|uniref:GTPase IMAP family member 6 n=1 Tax=Etheostoma spectabile TaxID=54343 RepID=UPI0013AEE01E|nr:GTPase IMAP family member 6-like [Etheostoma spectabile]
MDTGPSSCPDLTIVLLGHTGVGKSASGNTILGRPGFVSKRSFKSVTTQISTQSGPVLGKQISVIDTPGIIGSTREIQTLCKDLLKFPGPRLFLVVIKADRFTDDHERALDAALRAIGDCELSNCYLLFTGGDDLDKTSLDEYVNEDPGSCLKKLVDKFEGRYHLFNNKNGTQEQVRELLEKSGHLRNSDLGRERRERRERRVVLLGLPGSGKSSSGSTILGSEWFESVAGFNAGTTETASKSARVEGFWVQVVDTPGFTGQVLAPRKLFEEIMKAVVEASPGPHAFLIVVRFDRISEADIKLFKMLPKLFTGEASKYMMVLFTHGDALRGRSMDGLIRSNQHVSALVSRCGGRFCVFDNTKKGNRVQVRDLLDKIDQMVEANGGEHYTSDVFKEAHGLGDQIAMRWRQIGEWFRRKLRNLDRRRDGYTPLNQPDTTELYKMD